MMNKDTFLKDLEEAEMVLIGLGEEFQNLPIIKKNFPQYVEQKNWLEDNKFGDLIPGLEKNHRKRSEDTVIKALNRLRGLMENKNYYIVSVAINDVIDNVEWKNNHYVAPCGSAAYKQCECGCDQSITNVTEDDVAGEKILFAKNSFEDGDKEEFMNLLGTCSKCGGRMVYNTVYCEKYDENGYLDKWKEYTKWLQGTLNKKMLILELGVGLDYPSVIRWPFEKIGFYNNKAKFYRVNHSLYQLTEDLAQKGVGIAENAIDWLNSL